MLKTNKIKKAVIPAAGLGIRFLPVTKAVPKELLPIVDKPILLFIVEEAFKAGIEEIVLIQGRGKEAIVNFFDTSFELEETLEKSGRLHLLKDVEEIRSKVKIVTIRQQKALGLGHAVLTARPVIGDEAFAVLLGDEIHIAKPGQPSAIGQLCELFEKSRLSAVAVMPVPDEEVSRYGIVAAERQKENLWKVLDVIEKPSLQEAPSRLALPGRYVFDAKIFDYLEKAKPGKNGEIQLTDSMSELAKSHGMLATQVKGRRFDAGDKLGFLKANVEVGLEHSDFGAEFKRYLKDLVGGF
jgi:UTP--glucose-1-phosphate uridylyltransferase